MEYEWKPAGRDWDRLREIEGELATVGTIDADEIRKLIERTSAGLGFSKDEVAAFLADEAGGRRYVLEARSRIRTGSRRLGAALIAAEELADQGRPEEAQEQLRQCIRAEPVPFYREIAENELKDLC